MGFFADTYNKESPSSSSQYECEPVDDVEDEEQYGEGDEEELVYAPVLLRQLLNGDGGGGGALLDLVLEVVLAHDLDVHAVGGGDVTLLLEQDRGVPGIDNKTSQLKKGFAGFSEILGTPRIGGSCLF